MKITNKKTTAEKNIVLKSTVQSSSSKAKIPEKGKTPVKKEIKK